MIGLSVINHPAIGISFHVRTPPDVFHGYPVVNGGSDERSDWGIHIPSEMGSRPRSYLEFPKHLIAVNTISSDFGDRNERFRTVVARGNRLYTFWFFVYIKLWKISILDG